MRQQFSRDRSQFAVYADAESFLQPIDVHRALKNKDMDISGGKLVVANSSSPLATFYQQTNRALDWHEWLPFCAGLYNISNNPEDYVLLPTIICPSDIPNRNGVAFPKQELLAWEPEMKRPVYKAWIGCPTYSEHDNEDFSKARGVVVDSVFRPVTGFQGSIYKVLGLAAFDRNKYPEVANRLLTRQTTTVSMGAYVRSYSCGACGKVAGSCNHINLKRPRDFYIDPHSGRLVYRVCHGITPFELSEVQIPAWTVAESPHTIDLAAGTAISG